jgi:hypothetical protein
MMYCDVSSCKLVNCKTGFIWSFRVLFKTSIDLCFTNSIDQLEKKSIQLEDTRMDYARPQIFLTNFLSFRGFWNETHS